MRQQSLDASQKFDAEAERLHELIAELRGMRQTRALLRAHRLRLSEERQILSAEISHRIDDLHLLRGRLFEIEGRMEKSALRSDEPAAERKRGGRAGHARGVTRPTR